MKKVPFFVAAALALGLAACSEEKAEAPKSDAPPAQESAPAKTEAAPPATQPAPAATSQPASSSDVTDAAKQACLKAVTDQTNESDVAVLSSEFSEANSEVMVGVGANRAPWRCLVSNDGAVQEVMFTGNDGDGADQSAAPAENPATADDGGGAMAGSSSSDVSDAAVQACLTAVDSQTDGDVTVLSTEFSEANSMVMVGVGTEQAPWKCLVSNDGTGAEVSFAGDEGKL